LVRIQSPRPFQLKENQGDALALAKAPAFYRYSTVDDFVAVHLRRVHQLRSATIHQTDEGYMGRDLREKLKFTPEEDVVELPALLSKISGLGFVDILKIRDIVAQSVIVEEYIDVLSLITEVSEKHVQYE